MFESHAAFDPWTGDLYFVRSTPAFEGWRILVSRCGPNGWSGPVPPTFAGDGVEADPAFTTDGRSLYFISSRSTDGIHRSDLDLWRVDRDPQGRWRTPVRLPAPLNSDRQEWFPRLDSAGWLYFGSSREGGLGKTDIWRARANDHGAWQIENLGAAVNTADDEYEALPTPDGTALIIATATGFYHSALREGRWSTRTRLGPEINVNGTEIGALLSPTGRSMLFARDTKGRDSGEFVVWRTGPPEPWPPSCPSVAGRKLGP
jgi:hypothetical protein